MRYNGELIKGSHTAMITWKEYEKAQEIISHTNVSPNRIQTERPSRLEFAYTGGMRCDCCGCMITGTKKQKTIKSTGKIKEYTYYSCTHKKNNRDFKCTQKGCITENVIESQINELLEQIEIIPEFYLWARSVLKENYKNEDSGREAIVESIENSLASSEKKQNRLLHMRLAGEFDSNQNEYEKLRNELGKEIEILKIKRTEAMEEKVDWTEVLSDTINFSEYAVKRFQNGDIDTKRKIFRSVGQNWILKDGRAETNLQDWFFPFLRYKQFQGGYNSTSELNRKEIWIIKSDDPDLLITTWWAHLGLNQGPIGYEPTALTTEL